jgi:isocitrate dehydrogenase
MLAALAGWAPPVVGVASARPLLTTREEPMTDADSTIIYTNTDEGPMLATYSLLPIIDAFAGAAGVAVETRDISLAGRILAQFPDRLREDQRVGDHLAELGELAKRPEANIIKLPNISASLPQLKAAVAELQSQGFDVPSYPEDAEGEEAADIRTRYSRVIGSAVNPVLREGNSDRRAPAAVKAYAQKNPHSMGEWSSDSQSHVATMASGDFRSNEQSVTIDEPQVLRIELETDDGEVQILKDALSVEAGEIVDGTFMSRRALLDFLARQQADAAERGVLFSVHLKATMMKVSDPIIFGHAVRTFFPEVFSEHGETFARLGISADDGMKSLESAIAELDEEERAAIEADIRSAYESGPPLAQVDSDKGITNLHVPSDVIIDASMPAMIRTSGQMWNADGDPQDAKAVIPDSSYAGVYDVVIEDCKRNGAFDPTTMGTVPNVGLMAKKAEEYGSHDKTFELPSAGTVRVVDAEDRALIQHRVEAGDIWRACQTKDDPIRDWVALAVRRARATGWPAVFWLDADRAHDAQLIEKIERYLGEEDTDGLELSIKSPVEATAFTLERVRRGENTISVTGNVLRDYLTDLFPILEVGTSAKMLSIVPLMAGGGLFETGAGGSAPKHIAQLIAENHLRWDSLGEFLALAASFEHLAQTTGNARAQVLADTLDRATGAFLENGRSPSRRAGELDNRGSHLYLALYWAQALAEQTDDEDLQGIFGPVAERLAAEESSIVSSLNEVQGEPVDIGGYYHPDPERTRAVMRPSETLNEIIASIG